MVQVLNMGAMKVLVYEFITELSYPVSPTLTLAILHLVSNLIISALKVISDVKGDNKFIVANVI